MHRLLYTAAGSALVLLLVLVTSVDARAQGIEVYRGPIIDMHLHAYGPEYLSSLPNPARGAASPATVEEHAQQTLEMMQRHNIVLGAVSGHSVDFLDYWHGHDSDRLLNSIIFGDPETGPGEAAMGEMMASGRLQILGEVTAQYHGLSPSDPVYDPYWAMAEEHGIPVGIHTGASFPGTPYTCCPKFRLRLGDPLLLEDMLVKYPRLKVYFMHAGGQYQSEALEMLAMYPQLYVDISVLTWLPGMEDLLASFLIQARERRVFERVMFGTDQMFWPEAVEMAVARVNSYDFLSHDDKQAIFYGNAARFLGLTEEVIALHHGGDAAIDTGE